MSKDYACEDFMDDTDFVNDIRRFGLAIEGDRVNSRVGIIESRHIIPMIRNGVDNYKPQWAQPLKQKTLPKTAVVSTNEAVQKWIERICPDATTKIQYRLINTACEQRLLKSGRLNPAAV